jgi:non-heme chloroperoxidase
MQVLIKRAERSKGVLPFFVTCHLLIYSGLVLSKEASMRKNEFQPIRLNGGVNQAGWVESTDGARIYVETAGRGPVIMLVHGWTMSSRFWLRQMKGLSDSFQVVTMDLRAHGNSSKTLEGHNMARYSEDIHAVMTALKLEKVSLTGWSLAGPVVLEYWRRFGAEKLSSLALVEMTPFPFSREEWNTHSLKGYNLDGLQASFRALKDDRSGFGQRFIHNMFQTGHAPSEELDWMFYEHMKTPKSVAIAVYSDYVMGDYTEVLKDVSIPSRVINGNSEHLCFGPKTGRYVADQIPGCRLEILDQSGHMPFYEQPADFNKILADLASRSN